MKHTTAVDYQLDFAYLSEREHTDLIVIHHTGNPQNDNLSAATIHDSHIAQGWAGIGYHFVVRKNGTVELGRPVECLGSHAYGENYHSIGIHICGNFELDGAVPTSEQIEATARLLADLATEYQIIIDAETVVGHRDLMATACPGQNLYALLSTIRGKANWYLLN